MSYSTLQSGAPEVDADPTLEAKANRLARNNRLFMLATVVAFVAAVAAATALSFL